MAEKSNANQKKRRGRPPGSKNKKAKKVSVSKSKPSSLENTIKELLRLSATPEVKLRLIEAAIGSR